MWWASLQRSNSPGRVLCNAQTGCEVHHTQLCQRDKADAPGYQQHCGCSWWPCRDKQTQPCCVCHDSSVAKLLQRSPKPSCACWRCSPTFLLLVGDTTPQGHPVPARTRALGRRCLLHPAVYHSRGMRVKALTASPAQVNCDWQSLTCPAQLLLVLCFR